jgi:endogenous inhibitor of DNA gyrase (YacG/DUF329 family)
MPSAQAYIDGMPTSEPSERRCVICGKPQVEGLRPFCSKRCADVDLHRWLSGAYAIPVVEEELEDSPPDAERDTRKS